jgi:hypothetical protein
VDVDEVGLLVKIIAGQMAAAAILLRLTISLYKLHIKLREAKPRPLVIWATGCGFDFCQHEYWIKNHHLDPDKPAEVPDLSLFLSDAVLVPIDFITHVSRPYKNGVFIELQAEPLQLDNVELTITAAKKQATDAS